MTVSKTQTQAVRLQLLKIADKVVVGKDGLWTITKNLTTEPRDQLDSYVEQVADVLCGMQQAIMLVEAKPQKGGARTPSTWQVKFELGEAELPETRPVSDRRSLLSAYSKDLYQRAVTAGKAEAELRRLQNALACSDRMENIPQKLASFLRDYERDLEAAPQPTEPTASKIDQAVAEPDYDWKLFCKLAETVEGDAETGNFKGSIRTDITDVTAAEELAVTYYKVLKQFCVTATCTMRQRKDEGYTIALSAGALRAESPAEAIAA